MNSIRQMLPNYSFQDYERWEGRWEIINGFAYDMSPMPNPRHQKISIKLSRIFDEAIEISGCKKCDVYQPIDYKIDDNTIVNPDLLIVCSPIKGQYLEFAPHLIVEILSPSTALKDQNTKFDIYQQCKVKYYIIIDPEDHNIAIYQLNESDKYLKVDIDTFDLDGCQIRVNLEKCFG